MIEIVVIALLLFIVAQEYQHRQEKKRLMEAFLAKNLTELKQGEFTEKLEPLKDEEKEPEFKPVEDASDEEFDKAIKKELGREGRLEKAKETLKKVVRR